MRQTAVAGTKRFLPWSISVDTPTPSPEPFDSAQAISEGWMIIQSANRHQPWQLQRVDHARAFNSDVEAWCFVFDRADQGSVYHQQALSFLTQQAKQPVL